MNVLLNETGALDGIRKAAQKGWLGNGNEAVARAIIDIGYDAEGYYPITPSSDVGEMVSKAVAVAELERRFGAKSEKSRRAAQRYQGHQHPMQRDRRSDWHNPPGEHGCSRRIDGSQLGAIHRRPGGCPPCPHARPP